MRFVLRKTMGGPLVREELEVFRLGNYFLAYMLSGGALIFTGLLGSFSQAELNFVVLVGTSVYSFAVLYFATSLGFARPKTCFLPTVALIETGWLPVLAAFVILLPRLSSPTIVVFTCSLVLWLIWATCNLAVVLRVKPLRDWLQSF